MSLRHVETRETPADCRAESRLDVWRAGDKPFYVLSQRGRFRDLCYDHGRLLAAELEDGVFPEILATIAGDVDASPSLETGLVDSLQGAFFNRLSEDVLRSCSDEFRRGVEALETGYLRGCDRPRFGGKAVQHACVAIDGGNIATGFTRIRNYRARSREYAFWRNYVTTALTDTPAGRSYADTAAHSPHEAVPLADWLARHTGARGRRAGMGCTGFWAAPDLTADGLGLHARNFDGAFFDWNRYPVVSLIDERPDDPSYLRYAAVGTAGLIYPGGINGMNEAGLAVSLHQMSTVNFTVGDGSGAYDLAPYVQQRILRQARTLDEAVDIVRDRRHFASWTIFVSHAPSGRALRIEINGAERPADEFQRLFGDTYVKRIEASAPAERMVQTNHFLADKLKERHAFFDDAHFTSSVGKWLETRARMTTATTRLTEATDAKTLDTPNALALLADHHDAAAGGAQRSFGRTICKAYSLMSSLMRAHPDRDAGGDELWFTVGATGGVTPGPHTPLVGFGIDWEKLQVTGKGVEVATTASEGELTAMRAYVSAFQAHDRPRQPDGQFFRRQPTAAEMQKIRHVALAELDRAVAAAEATGLSDPTFRYIRARLRHAAALASSGTERTQLLNGAGEDWARLRGMSADNGVAMTDWERALIHLLSAATAAAGDRGQQDKVADWLEAGGAYLKQVAQAEFGDGPVHQDIKTWRKVMASIDADGPDAELPEIDFVTVE
ncbi:C45 family autoproteolytic acyltransferase/hydolase [Rhodovibrio salinarum]|uniref:Peptidase C45 hydrolase domain-containing protein n=1 Tax=Rhodovibrio salinarum TaxID=1087 RepID=A0A934QJN0_9PROT|nr:C45 family autoproteolytic acyltransferase/hydolase [Rhodovibrio salinarum]MBK1698122.1 hypothetical protein [Rhodovibrio salinarum]